MIRKLTFICMCSLTLGVQAGEINRTNDSLKVIIPQTDLLKPVEPSYLKNVTTTSGWDSNWFLNVVVPPSSIVRCNRCARRYRAIRP